MTISHVRSCPYFKKKNGIVTVTGYDITVNGYDITVNGYYTTVNRYDILTWEARRSTHKPCRDRVRMRVTYIGQKAATSTNTVLFHRENALINNEPHCITYHEEANSVNVERITV